MNWEVDVYKVTAKASCSVHDCETKADAEQAALQQIQLSKARVVECGEGWIAQATTWPYHQTVQIANTYQIAPPKLWSPPTWMSRKAINIGGNNG